MVKSSSFGKSGGETYNGLVEQSFVALCEHLVGGVEAKVTFHESLEPCLEDLLLFFD
jgi:hypothetical protein